MEKEKAAQLFDTKIKNIHGFTLETPEKNKVEGFICKSRGSKMGSLIIETVNDKQTLQYVQGMPKIQYLDERDDVSVPVVLAKEDGTNIVHFPLMDHQGNVIETLFKTRLMPSCQNKFQKLVNQCINDDHFRAVEKTKLSYSYELFGYENNHEVNYRFLDIPLELELITILDQGFSLPYHQTLKKAEKYNIKRIPQQWDVTQSERGFEFNMTTTLRLFDGFFDDSNEKFTVTTLRRGYKELESFYEKININYQKDHQGGIITEGAVWHYGTEENHMKKNKAISVREGHIKQACGIPHHDIKKAVMKAEENMDIFNEDKNKIIEFIKAELKEEYPEIMFNDTNADQKINSILSKHTQKLVIDDKMRVIVEKLNEECGVEASPADKMRYFAQEYPDLRKMSRKLYQAVVKM